MRGGQFSLVLNRRQLASSAFFWFDCDARQAGGLAA